ncbi:MAG: recombinase family protein [Candidatus Riflebacteria bacterium]|nr:recombinase family protein [Candidatus Riflebacteria bacterium]
MRIAVYARYSSSNQREESIDSQLRAIESFAKIKGMSIVKVYADSAKSATSDKRPEFQQMISDGSKKMFEAVVVHKLDRFSRDKYDSCVYKKRLRDYGIKVISVTEFLDDSPESMVLESMLEGMAAYFSKNLAREVMKGMKENAYKGLHNGGKPPIGYLVDKSTKKLLIEPEEAEVVKSVFEMYLNDWGYQKILQHLNATGKRTKFGKLFGKNAIFTILRNEKYTGVYKFNVSPERTSSSKRKKTPEEIIVVPDALPVIIDRQTFDRVQIKLKENKNVSGKFKAKSLYLLSGLVECGECGHPYHANSRNSGKRNSFCATYRCSHKAKLKTACQNREIGTNNLEYFVMKVLEGKLLNERIIPKLMIKLNDYIKKRQNEKSGDLEKLKKQKQEILEQLDRLLLAISKGIDASSVRERILQFEDEKVKIETRILEMQNSLEGPIFDRDKFHNLLNKYREEVKKRNLPECKKIIKHFVEKVIVYHDSVDIVLKMPIYSIEEKQSDFFLSYGRVSEETNNIVHHNL